MISLERFDCRFVLADYRFAGEEFGRAVIGAAVLEIGVKVLVKVDAFVVRIKLCLLFGDRLVELLLVVVESPCHMADET